MRKEWDAIERQTLRAGFALPEDFPTAAKSLAASGKQPRLDKRNNSVNVWYNPKQPAGQEPSGAFVTEVQLDPSQAERHGADYQAASS